VCKDKKIADKPETVIAPQKLKVIFSIFINKGLSKLPGIFIG